MAKYEFLDYVNIINNLRNSLRSINDDTDVIDQICDSLECVYYNAKSNNALADAEYWRILKQLLDILSTYGYASMTNLMEIICDENSELIQKYDTEGKYKITKKGL